MNPFSIGHIERIMKRPSSAYVELLSVDNDNLVGYHKSLFVLLEMRLQGLRERHS